jgi:hypothetical protein
LEGLLAIAPAPEAAGVAPVLEEQVTAEITALRSKHGAKAGG